MTAEARSFFLQRRLERRFRLLFVLPFLVVSHLIPLTTIVVGVADLVRGDLGGAAWLLLGVLGLGPGVLVAAALGRWACRPRLRVDLGARTLAYRYPDGDVLPFAEAEEMTLGHHFGWLCLAGPRTNASGIRVRKGSFYLSELGGGPRNDGGQHPLAEILPTPLAGLSDDMMVVDDMEWVDAFKLAVLLNVRSIWSAGRTTISPLI